MACFLVPTAEAVVTTVVGRVLKAKEKAPELSNEQNSILRAEVKIPFSRKLKWLSNLLWGGSVLLAFEHLWHGEIAPWFPFLTAMNDPEETVVMLKEMVSVGGTMSIWLTLVWFGMILAADRIVKRPDSEFNAVKGV